MKKLALLLTMLGPLFVLGQELEAGTIVIRKAAADESLPLVGTPTSTDFTTDDSKLESSRERKILKPGLYVASYSDDAIHTREPQATKPRIGGRWFKKWPLREYLHIKDDGQATYFQSNKKPKKVLKKLRKKRPYDVYVIQRNGNWEYNDTKENNQVSFSLQSNDFSGTLSFSGIYNQNMFKTERYSDADGTPKVSDQTFIMVDRKGGVGI